MKKSLLVALALSALTIAGCSSSKSSTPNGDEGIGPPVAITNMFDGVWRVTDITGYGELSDVAGEGYFIINGNRIVNFIDFEGVSCTEVESHFQTLSLVTPEGQSPYIENAVADNDGRTLGIETFSADNTLTVRYLNTDGSVRTDLSGEFVSAYTLGDVAKYLDEVSCAPVDTISGVWEVVGVTPHDQAYTETSGITGRVFIDAIAGMSTGIYSNPANGVSCLVINSVWDLETNVKTTDLDSNKHIIEFNGSVESGRLEVIDNDIDSGEFHDSFSYTYVGTLEANPIASYNCPAAQ